MPYYAWKGVTLTGALCRGRTCARSRDELDKKLFARDVALIRCTPKRLSWWHKRSVSEALKIDFFRQLGSLVSSGIFLAESLDMVSSAMHTHPRLQEIIIGLGDKVQQGVSLSVALAEYPDFADPLTIQMASVGGDTGALGTALHALCDDLELRQDLRARLRSAAFLPGCTFLFFMVVATVLVAVVIPRFATIFSLYGADLPSATKKLIALSDYLCSWHFPILLSFTAFGVLMLRAYARSIQGKPFFDRCWVRLPLIGSMVRSYVVANALRAVAMLLGRGVPLMTALRTVRGTVANTVLREQLLYCEQEVAAGVTLSHALQQLNNGIFDQECIAAVRIGQASGQLAPMLMRATDLQYEKIKRDLVRFTTLVQPMLMLVLGLLITGLIIAVYMPIFSLSHIIG